MLSTYIIGKIIVTYLCILILVEIIIYIKSNFDFRMDDCCDGFWWIKGW